MSAVQKGKTGKLLTNDSQDVLVCDRSRHGRRAEESDEERHMMMIIICSCADVGIGRTGQR